MKQMFVLAMGLFSFSLIARSQSINDTIRVVLENNEINVSEYVSTPGKDVCGNGRHSHPAHLSILLTDADVRLTKADGQTQDFHLKSGDTFWSEAETHIAINNGSQPAKAYIVEVKR
jgi:hypothetical protein